MRLRVLSHVVWFIIVSLTCVRLYTYLHIKEPFNTGVTCQQNWQSLRKICVLIENTRQNCISKLWQYLPSPHSELLLGMVVGSDYLEYVPGFEENLLRTGTVHVVVVSGYNISLVFGMVISVLGTRYRLRNVLMAELVTFIYAAFSGLQLPVVRSWIMGSIASLGKYYGRSIAAEKLLIFSALFMLLLSPNLVSSASFHLSFLACLSLLFYNNGVSHFIARISKKRMTDVSWFHVLIDDFSTSVSAQILVWPYISYKFGRVSLISPFVNSLILWTVPVSTVLGFLLLPLTFVSHLLSTIVAYIVYVPLDIFISAVSFFGRFSLFYLDYQIPFLFLISYYVFLLVIRFLSRGR